jgi:hypothetical protein
MATTVTRGALLGFTLLWAEARQIEMSLSSYNLQTGIGFETNSQERLKPLVEIAHHS